MQRKHQIAVIRRSSARIVDSNNIPRMKREFTGGGVPTVREKMPALRRHLRHHLSSFKNQSLHTLPLLFYTRTHNSTLGNQCNTSAWGKRNRSTTDVEKKYASGGKEYGLSCIELYIGEATENAMNLTISIPRQFPVITLTIH